MRKTSNGELYKEEHQHHEDHYVMVEKEVLLPYNLDASEVGPTDVQKEATILQILSSTHSGQSSVAAKLMHC